MAAHVYADTINAYQFFNWRNNPLSGGGGGARDVAHEAEKGGTCSARVGFYVSSGESPRKIAASSRPFVE
jgi:hypothetical protein